ncbi:MAG: hypothetical protein GOP50_07790 [Candidatus Heimdallarchaeota archaeon]|nr:hypothetical protein [Candidatus Heimdallarchaeota archaeon]
MVYLSYIIALFLVCFGLGFLILLFTKSRNIMVFGFFFLIISGVILISGTVLTTDAILFLILGLYAISLILLFVFRDELKIKLTVEKQRSDSHE